MIAQRQTAQPARAQAPTVSGVLQRACACGNHTVAGGECEACRRRRTGALRRAAISPTSDIYEQEADRVADQVAAAPAHHAIREAPLRIQRFAGQPADRIDTAPASVDRALASPGRPLEPALRQDMERRFGHDFSQVRVHVGGAAEQSARDVQAHAYTVGSDIVFDTGRFAPETQAGRRLLAHELTHVVQQGSGQTRQLQRQPAGCQQLLLTPQLGGGPGGTAIHRAIEGHFQASVAGATSVAIPGASAGPLRTQGLCGADDAMIRPQQTGSTSPRGGVGIPDLARITTGGILQVAEIKPASIVCLIDGEEQLLRYIDQGNARDADQVAWRRGLGISVVAPMPPAAYQPPSLTVGMCQILTAWCSPGMMVYAVQCPGLPVPLPQPQEQEQQQEQPARVPTLRLPRGPIWDKVYGAIAIIGGLAALFTLSGKVGALLGLLLRALGFSLGLAIGAAAASAGTSGAPTVKPVPVTGSGPPGPGPAPGRTTGAKERKGAPATGTTARTPAPATQAIKVDVIEGVNAERVAVGMVFPVQFHDAGRKQGEEMFGVAILQVTRVVKEEGGITVEFISLQERMSETKTGESKTAMGGRKTYTLTHPYRVSESRKPGLVGYVMYPGDRQWFWTYLDNLANTLESAGQKGLAAQVRKEVQRLRQQAERAKP